MAFGNMNPGLVIVRCLDSATRTPVEGATAILTWVQADASFGGRLKLYNTEGKEDPAPSAQSDKSGVAFIKFLWDPIHETYLISDSPSIRVSAVGPAMHYSGWFSSKLDNKQYFTTRVGNERVYVCVNLGQVYGGGQGEFQFRSGESHAMDALSKLKDILSFRAKVAGDKIPSMPYLKIMRPELEMLSLLGGFDVWMSAAA